MAKIRRNFDKNINLSAVASKNEMRPVLQMIKFKDGFVIATDSEVLVKLKINQISSFEEDEIKLLEGKMIHYKEFELLQKFDFVTIVGNGFLCRTSSGSKILIEFDPMEGKYPNVDAVIPKDDIGLFPRCTVGLCISRISRLRKAMPSNRCVFEIRQPNIGVLLKPSDEEYNECLGLIMPYLVEI